MAASGLSYFAYQGF